MTYREIKKIFIQFLKKNNALESYKKNVIESNKHKRKKTLVNFIDPLTFPAIKEAILRTKAFESIISFSFVWVNTEEGREFWSNLNRKWIEISKEYEIINEKI